MDIRLFHIFRNTPLGRETLLQSLYFCQQIAAALVIYIPEYTRFLMYFENDVVQIDLDSSYLTSPETALEHAVTLAREKGLEPRFISPKNFTASVLPDIPVDFDFMACPRSISDLSSKIGLGYIGPRVRRIVQSARFPVLMTSPVYKPWNSVMVLFGGSTNAVKALKLGLRLSRLSGKPLEVLTWMERSSTDDYKEVIRQAELEHDMEQFVSQWHFLGGQEGKHCFEEDLYHVPHDALVVLGAYGHSLLRDFLFGNKMERIQSTLSNNMVIVGPNYTSNL
jgi:nucleotide-binding universal stress UspA family protein